MTGTATHRAAVLGSPIAHSLSPALHRAAYAALGLAGWRYEAYDVTEPDLAEFLDRLEDSGGSWAGLSLTMPLKAAVLPLLDEASATVRAVGAANTVLLHGGQRRGHNTDVPGMVAALTAAGVGTVAEVAVLGGGATARSAVAAATGTRARQVTTYVRSPARAEGLAATATATGVSLAVRGWDDAVQALRAPLVVNTTPAGAADALAGSVPGAPGVLLEVLYEPWPTPLAAAWAGRGGRVVDGLALLVAQAVRQVGLMTGVDVAARGLEPVLRAAGERALAQRSSRSPGEPMG